MLQNFRHADGVAECMTITGSEWLRHEVTKFVIQLQLEYRLGRCMRVETNFVKINLSDYKI